MSDSVRDRNQSSDLRSCIRFLCSTSSEKPSSLLDPSAIMIRATLYYINIPDPFLYPSSCTVVFIVLLHMHLTLSIMPLSLCFKKAPLSKMSGLSFEANPNNWYCDLVSMWSTMLTFMVLTQQQASSHIPLMFFDNSQDVVGKVAWVLWEPEELFELSLEKFHLGLLPCQSVPHTL